MKYLLRLIALAMLAIFVFALPISLSVRGFGEVLFNPERAKDIVRSALVQEEFIANIAKQATQAILIGGDESDNPASLIVQNGLEQLSQDEWGELISIVAPAEVVAGSADLLIDSYADWLNGDEELPVISLDLAPWKESIAANSDKILERVMTALPECSTEELADLAIDSLTSGAEAIGSIPACKPPEPLYSLVIISAREAVPRFLRAAPDEIDLGAMEIRGLDQLIQLKETLNRVRFAVNWAWLLVVGLGAVAILIGARTLAAALKWAGWSLLIAGLITLVLRQLLGIFSSYWLSNIVSTLFNENADLVLSALSNLFGEVIEVVSSQLAVQAGYILAAAVLAIVLRQMPPYWKDGTEAEK